MATYSFLDVQATLTGPSGSIQLGQGAENSEEGITIEQTNDRNVMVTGADGAVMHSLRASNAGTITVNLLKTSPTNAKLSDMYNAQTVSSLLHGKNVITIRNVATGDTVVATQVAFKRDPNNSYATEGGTMQWQFDAGHINTKLGSGNPEA